MRRWLGLSVLVVLAYAGAAGYFGWRTFVSPPAPDYRPLLRWEAPWISSARTDVSQSYFRKKLFLNRQPEHAWIAVIAPDQFALFVNGKRVLGPDGEGQEDEEASAGDPTRTKWTTLQILRPSALTQVVFDITPYLVAGTNVIAVQNSVTTLSERPRIAVQGAYLDPSGRWFPLVSDAGWRVALRDESLTSQSGIVSATSWTDPAYDDGRWSFVVAGDVPTGRMTSALLAPPPLVTEPLRSDWLWADASAPETYLRLAVDLPARPRDGWLRILARRHYRILVNEYPIVFHEQALGTDAPEERVISLYSIAPYLRHGRNVIAVHASNDRADRGLALDGLLIGADGAVTWLSPAAGKAAPRPAVGWETPTFDDSGWGAPRTLKPVSPDERAVLSTTAVVLEPPVSFRLRMLGLGTATLLVSVAAALALWLLSATLLARLTGVTRRAAAAPVAFTFLPPGVLLGVVYLLGFDPRLSQAFPFRSVFLVGSIALLLALQAALLAAALLSRAGWYRPGRGRARAWKRALLSSLVFDPGWLAAFALAVIGLRLRLQDLVSEALLGDEVNSLQWSLGVLQRGYPSTILEGRIKAAFTSELEFYVKALGVWLLGPNALGLRLPDVILGSLTIVLLYWVGKQLHGARVGLLAATCYTLLPSAIGMTHYARYPAQVQFVALLTFVLLLRAIEGGEFRARRYWAAIVSFIATYLSWEGAAFYGLALAVGVFVLTRPKFDWLRKPQMWAGVGITTGIVVIQLSLRYADQVDWPYYGTGLQDVSPAITALYPFYDPLYYLWTFFLIENHHLLTLLFVLGAPWWFRRSRPGRILGFMAATILTNLGLMGNLLELGHWRYAYLLLPLLILSASMVLILALDRARALVRAPEAAGAWLAGVRHATAIGLVTGFLVFSTSFAVKLYELPWSYSSQYTRFGIRNNPSTASAVEYVRPRLLPGDVLISFVPHVWNHYLGRADYYFQPQLDQAIFVGPTPGLPIQRNAGAPTILGPADLRDMRTPAPRVWFITFGVNLANPELDARMVYEDWHSAVYLFGPGNEPLGDQGHSR